MLGNGWRGSRKVLVSGALVTALGALSVVGCHGDDGDTEGTGGAGGAGGEGASIATGGAGGVGAGGGGAGGIGPGGMGPGGSGGLVEPLGSGGSKPGDWPFGGTCEGDDDCANAVVGGQEVRLECWTKSRGGVCTRLGCSDRHDCPDDGHCVKVTVDGETIKYCAPNCSDGDNCNQDRGSDGPSTCTDEFDHADPASEPSGLKACIPPLAE